MNKKRIQTILYCNWSYKLSNTPVAFRSFLSFWSWNFSWVLHKGDTGQNTNRSKKCCSLGEYTLGATCVNIKHANSFDKTRTHEPWVVILGENEIITEMITWRRNDDFHFSLKVKNGVQNAICAPGVSFELSFWTSSLSVCTSIL